MRVETCKLLGIEFNKRPTWQEHIEKVHKKASARRYVISQLQSTKVKVEDVVKVYISLVRPITEYACHVWHPCLTPGQVNLLESIQECALAMICSALK